MAGSRPWRPSLTSSCRDQLWAMVEPLLPVPPRPPYGGRRRAIPDRNCFAAIVHMARASTPWRLLPVQELGCGSPSTCWRRLTEWANAGVFDQLRLEILDRLGAQGRLDWSRASVGTMSVGAKRGGPCVGANPVDRGKPGSKLHLVCEGGGLPLAAVVTAATSPIPPCSQRCWPTSRRSARRRGGAAPDPPRFTPIRAMTAEPTVPTCGSLGSRRGSLGGRSSRRPGLGAPVEG
jgi:transposase